LLALIPHCAHASHLSLFATQNYFMQPKVHLGMEGLWWPGSITFYFTAEFHIELETYNF